MSGEARPATRYELRTYHTPEGATKTFGEKRRGAATSSAPLEDWKNRELRRRLASPVLGIGVHPGFRNVASLRIDHKNVVLFSGDRALIHLVHSMVNFTNLRPFERHGGKIIMYQSWQEAAIPPMGLVNYYESGFSVGAYRGAWNALDVIEKWRETGVAPDKVVAEHHVNGGVDRTHPVCPYPQAAIYKGSGDPYDASSFTCWKPTWK